MPPKMPLTNIECQTAKPKEKPYKMADGGGLYLEVMPNESKYWRLKYRYLGKESRLALGVYPSVSLADAREGRERTKKLLKGGSNPSFAKKEEKRRKLVQAEETFEVIAREWHDNQRSRWTDVHIKDTIHRLEVDIFPHMGKRPIAEIRPPEMLEIIRKIENRGAHEIARRTLRICGQVFRYSIVTGRSENNPAANLSEALKPHKVKHFAALDYKELPDFLRVLGRNEVRLYKQTVHAVKMLMLTFVRTNELINATWDEFDFEAKQWNIPAERMKMGNPHIVPF